MDIDYNNIIRQRMATQAGGFSPYYGSLVAVTVPRWVEAMVAVTVLRCASRDLNGPAAGDSSKPVALSF